MNADPAPAVSSDPFADLEQLARERGVDAALDRLVAILDDGGEPRALLDALLLKARHELGLPAVQDGPLGTLPEPQRSRYEDRYVEAIRRVGGKLLDAGELVAAWPYFRAIGEAEPVARAIEAYEPAEGDDRVGQVVEIAFNGGAHPRRGFELILSQYGACSAITAFDHLPQDAELRAACAAMLIRNLHAHLTESLRADIARHGQPMPAAGASVPELLAGRDWLFADDGYHLDVSHLAAVVRMALLATDREATRLAVELAEYGQHLSERHRYEGEPPFQNTYEDHAIYLRALRGEAVDEAVAHFRAKLATPDPDGPSPSESVPAQVLVRLLAEVGRLDEAIEVAAEHLAGLPETALVCPSLPQLCVRAGQADRLARIARERGDLVGFAAGLLAETDA